MVSCRHVLGLASMCLVLSWNCLQAQTPLSEIQCQQHLDRANWIKTDSIPGSQGSSAVASAADQCKPTSPLLMH